MQVSPRRIVKHVEPGEDKRKRRGRREGRRILVSWQCCRVTASAAYSVMLVLVLLVILFLCEERVLEFSLNLLVIENSLK